MKLRLVAAFFLSGAAGNRRLRRAFLWAGVMAASAGGAATVHERMTHVDVTDARIAAEMITVASRSPGWPWH